jgi:hypothetical protein
LVKFGHVFFSIIKKKNFFLLPAIILGREFALVKQHGIQQTTRIFASAVGTIKLALALDAFGQIAPLLFRGTVGLIALGPWIGAPQRGANVVAIVDPALIFFEIVINALQTFRGHFTNFFFTGVEGRTGSRNGFKGNGTGTKVGKVDFFRTRIRNFNGCAHFIKCKNFFIHGIKSKNGIFVRTSS